MENFKNIMYRTGQVLYIIWIYIYGALCSLGKWISEYFKNVILPMTPTMLKFFSNHTANVIMFSLVSGFFLIMNICAFCMFGSDKKKAARKARRISESRLMRVCVFGGAIGGMLGMHLFRHKTMKRKFKICVPILFIIQLIVQSFILGFLGFWAFF
ncbi:MAG: DUF1294 domain-containing protein [Clostridiales bacterium]|nr:DUF1294 domain-containing protein [Clostridiales bacterium]